MADVRTVLGLDLNNDGTIEIEEVDDKLKEFIW